MSASAIFFFEDQFCDRFAPIALTRPVFELICGATSLRDRITRSLGITRWGASLRPHLNAVYQQEHAEHVVTKIDAVHEQMVLCINGRWIPRLESLQQITAEEIVCHDQTVVACYLTHDEFQEFREASSGEFLNDYRHRRTNTSLPGRLLEYPWQLAGWNFDVLNEDMSSQQPSHRPISEKTLIDVCGNPLTIIGNPADLVLNPSAQIDPAVVFDVRTGPIFIDAGVKIQAFSRIEGPCYLGPGTQLFRAQIKGGTTIGPHCRIGGEIEASIIHAYANKYHDGFLGHSYVCPWTNLGAMTTNSDLKNNYQPVQFPIGKDWINTGEKKIGSLIGDHAKTAIGTMLNTGTSIGVMSMILPAGKLPYRHIPSFTYWWEGNLQAATGINELIATASLVMQRRDVELTPTTESLYRLLFQQTRNLREHVIEVQQTRKTQAN